tara:strand:- start:370 stop:1044 length:675 start_codon:yes stop_codon:yes gene_type:complete
MKKVFIYVILFLSTSCYKHSREWQALCDGNCSANYRVVYLNETIALNNDGYYEIEWNGLNYFQVIGDLSNVNSDYSNSDGVPFVSGNFDSDYWVLFDTLTFTIPTYSYLGWFNDQTMNTPISIGPYTYSMVDLIDLHPPLNIVGYQLPKHFCWDCPYAPTMVGAKSSYNYNPTCNVLLDNEMIGDTINIFIETIFNTEGGIYYTSSDDMTPQEIIENNLKIIIK